MNQEVPTIYASKALYYQKQTLFSICTFMSMKAFDVGSFSSTENVTGVVPILLNLILAAKNVVLGETKTKRNIGHAKLQGIPPFRSYELELLCLIFNHLYSYFH